jgi:hypothetical protein
MILSKMLGMIAENPNLLADKRFCELVTAAWEDVEFLFDQLHTNDKDNGLYGWKGQVQHTLYSSIWCIAHHPGHWKDPGHWKFAQRMAAQLEIAIKEELSRTRP